MWWYPEEEKRYRCELGMGKSECGNGKLECGIMWERLLAANCTIYVQAISRAGRCLARRSFSEEVCPPDLVVTESAHTKKEHRTPKDEHRTSNVQHRTLNGKDEETELQINQPGSFSCYCSLVHCIIIQKVLKN